EFAQEVEQGSAVRADLGSAKGFLIGGGISENSDGKESRGSYGGNQKNEWQTWHAILALTVLLAQSRTRMAARMCPAAACGLSPVKRLCGIGAPVFATAAAR